MTTPFGDIRVMTLRVMTLVRDMVVVGFTIPEGTNIDLDFRDLLEKVDHQRGRWAVVDGHFWTRWRKKSDARKWARSVGGKVRHWRREHRYG